MTLNPHQLSAKQGFLRGEHIVLESLAGSGKTFMVTHLINEIPAIQHSRVLATAHNTHIVRTFEDKLPSDVTKKGLHALGLKLLKSCFNNYRPTYVQEQKYNWITQDALKSYDLDEKARREWTAATLKLWSACRVRLLNLCNTAHLQKCADLHDIELPYPVETAAELLSILSERGQREASWRVDFDDMLWLPETLDLRAPAAYDYVFLDEYQDTNKAQQALFKRIAGHAQVFIVGDRKQAIYGFSGADTNAQKVFVDHYGAVVYRQPICYRCPTSHITEAQMIVPELQAAPGAMAGTVEKTNARDLYRNTPYQKGDMILCRNRKPLVEMYLRLVERGVPAYIKGSSGGDGLVDVIDRATQGQKVKFDGVLRLIDAYAEKRAAALMASGDNERQVNDLRDRIGTVKVLYYAADDKGVTSVYEWKKFIEAQFSDKPTGDVMLATVHAAKGLETDNVYLLEPQLMHRASGKATGQVNQEANVKYISLTRGKQRLTYLEERAVDMVL